MQPGFNKFGIGGAHTIHRLAQKKQDGAFVSAMIDRFHADTADPSRQSLANIIGNPLKKDPRDEVARNLKIRSNELFTQLFPEHAKPHRAGHLLPKVPRLDSGWHYLAMGWSESDKSRWLWLHRLQLPDKSLCQVWLR